MKKKYIVMAIVAAATLALAACAKTQQEGASVTMVVEEREAEAETEVIVEEIIEEETVPQSEWKVLLETKIEHESNMEGFLNDRFGVTVGYKGQIFYTNDGAKTWKPATNESWCRFCLTILDENRLMCGGNGNQVRFSTDGAQNWTAVSDINLSAIHSNIDFADDNIGWVSTNIKAAATTDGGQTWKEFVLPEEFGSIAALSVRNENEGCLLTHQGQLLSTTDCGESWTQKDTGLTELGMINETGKPELFKSNTTSADMNFTDGLNGMIVFAGTVPGEGSKAWVMYTTDGGETFTTEELPVPEGFKASKVFLSKDSNYITLGNLFKEVVVLGRE